jgi:hypothetical protein
MRHTSPHERRARLFTLTEILFSKSIIAPDRRFLG